MAVFERKRDTYLISTDRSLLDLDFISSWLRESSYWAQSRPLDVLAKSLDHSLCFGLYAAGQQVGFARVVTDYATFAWLCDVFVCESEQGRGLGKWLIECVVAHPELSGLNQIILATRDAHELYRRYGNFEPLEAPEKWMARRNG